MPLDITTFEASAFQKCAPYKATNIKQCGGSVTACNAIPLEIGDINDVYMSGSDYRVMDAILKTQMEIRQCEAVQNGLFDFLMANKVNLSKRLQVSQRNAGLWEIAPFIKAKQYSPINNEYWKIVAGDDTSAVALPTGHWNAVSFDIVVQSTSGIPVDIRSFPAGMYIYVQSRSLGASTKAAYMVLGSSLTTVTTTDDAIQVSVTPLSVGTAGADWSHMDGIKRQGSTRPTSGLVMRGTPNVSDFERWCNEMPAYMNWKHVPFWMQTTRTSMCKSSLYDKYRSLLLENNPLYREFGDLDEVERNKQLGADFQRRWVNSFFYNPRLPNQDLARYNDLPEIKTAPPVNGKLGAYPTDTDGKCVGKRANAVGVYEQMAECDRIVDCLGDQLNLPALFQELYNILRVREGNGNKTESLDLFTDSVTAERMNTAMIKYYNSKSDGTLRLTMDVNQDVKKGPFGFNFRSYRLFWPNVTINIVTHYFFDDYVTAAKAGFGGLDADEDFGRVMWILDFAGIYPGIIASNRVVHKTGDLKTMAAVDADWACVMAVPTEEQTMTSLTYTVVVECPFANLIIENFSADIPSIVDQDVDYSSGGTEGQLATTTAA